MNSFARAARVPRRRAPFTLVEVLAAMAVLSLSLTPFLTLANTAQLRLLKAQEKWRRFHMLSQAAEYMMLQGMDDPELPGPDVFDYPGYKIVCEYKDATDVPEDLNDLVGQARLRCCVIELVDTASGETVDSLRIERIDYDEVNDEETSA